jgi:hypothetical protein
VRIAARALVVAVAILAVAGSGCAGDDDGASPTGPSTTSSPTTTALPTLEGAATVPVEAPGEASETALLTRVEIGRNEGFDRVVFEFREDLPGYRIEYVEGPLSEDGSGNPVQLDGSAYLVVRMEPASGFDLGVPEGELVYTGPRRLSGTDVGAVTVREAVRTGDFEAVLTWAVGVNGRTPFRVLRLDEPARLVIDFGRPVE